MQQANENGIAHVVIRETLGAAAHFACGGWNYWVRLKHGGGKPCAPCAREMAEMRKAEAEARRMQLVKKTKASCGKWHRGGQLSTLIATIRRALTSGRRWT